MFSCYFLLNRFYCWQFQSKPRKKYSSFDWCFPSGSRCFISSIAANWAVCFVIYFLLDSRKLFGSRKQRDFDQFLFNVSHKNEKQIYLKKEVNIFRLEKPSTAIMNIKLNITLIDVTLSLIKTKWVSHVTIRTRQFRTGCVPWAWIMQLN